MHQRDSPAASFVAVSETRLEDPCPNFSWASAMPPECAAPDFVSELRTVGTAAISRQYSMRLTRHLCSIRHQFSAYNRTDAQSEKLGRRIARRAPHFRHHHRRSDVTARAHARRGRPRRKPIGGPVLTIRRAISPAAHANHGRRSKGQDHQGHGGPGNMAAPGMAQPQAGTARFCSPIASLAKVGAAGMVTQRQDHLSGRWPRPAPLPPERLG